MKKLIDELEKLKGQGYGVNGISRDAAIEDCINIVRNYKIFTDRQLQLMGLASMMEYAERGMVEHMEIYEIIQQLREQVNEKIT